jgi:hypothetical protein
VPRPDGSEALDHVVVALFENRSFDNLLGRLYEPGEALPADPCRAYMGDALGQADQARACYLDEGPGGRSRSASVSMAVRVACRISAVVWRCRNRTHPRTPRPPAR